MPKWRRLETIFIINIPYGQLSVKFQSSHKIPILHSSNHTANLKSYTLPIILQTFNPTLFQSSHKLPILHSSHHLANFQFSPQTSNPLTLSSCRKLPILSKTSNPLANFQSSRKIPILHSSNHLANFQFSCKLPILHSSNHPANLKSYTLPIIS